MMRSLPLPAWTESFPGIQVKLPKLVESSHSDVEMLADPANVPR